MKKDNNTFLTPSEIVSELNKYIIGQQNAKRHVAIALRNRWRRMQVPLDMQQEIIPNNILMIGATGVGKTEIARRLAKIADAPFTKVEASKFTEVGYVGRDVESMVRDLVEQSVSLVKTQKKEEVKEKAYLLAEEIILDALIPPLQPIDSTSSTQPTHPEGNEETRKRFREKIRTGELDDKKIEIHIQQNSVGGLGVVGPNMLDETSLLNLQEMMNSMMPKKTRKRKITIAEAKKILVEEEAAKLIDMDEVKEMAIQKAENAGIIFIDEIDKIASTGNKGGADVSREGVQRDLLPIVEGSSVNTKYGIVKTDHILFIAAGAFHLAKPSDLIPELQGRFPIRVELTNLTQDDFCRILKEPKNALTKQYQALFEAEGTQLVFEEKAIDEIAEIAFQINSEIENIGARRLHTVMSHLLNDLLYKMPDQLKKGTTVVITSDLVKEKLNDLVKNKDLSKYIL